jgi:ribonuclease HI
VYNRRLRFCASTEDWLVSDLIKECPHCGIFVLYCCGCSKYRQARRGPCHHFRLVFTDGACSNNGRPGAKAGAGVAVGRSDGAQLSAPITNSEDNFPVRSNQRAELYAARLGLNFLDLFDLMYKEEPSSTPKGKSQTWIIATDSQYVIKGMTEWLPKWRVRADCPSKGVDEFI